MQHQITPDDLSGVWSATPTPFTDDMRVDVASVERMVEHHLRLGVKGLFLAGTCGEGPWMTNRDRRALVKAVTQCAQGRLLIAVQVTDNSAVRILDNITVAQEDGADIGIIAPPHYLFKPTPGRILEHYRQAIRHSALPVGIYDQGSWGSTLVPESALEAIYAEQNVILVKDSSGQPPHREIALAARRKRPKLRLLNGSEFNCVEYLRAGYDGLLLGGAIFNGYMAGQILDAATANDFALAERLQERMNDIMYAVYGGKEITCWLSGLKKLLVEMGVFTTWKNLLDYPLTDDCVRSIERVLKEDADVLFP